MSFDWKTAASFVLLPFAGPFLGSFFTKESLQSWYDKLNLPGWRPPNWLFGLVRKTLNASMGLASYLVYRDGGGWEGAAKIPLVLYGLQLALNWAWIPVFLMAHNLKLAFFEILLTTGAISVTGWYFYQINQVAGLLFVPYQAWYVLSTCLAYRIWQDNKDKKD